ncbi:MAG: hypothetical protein ABIH25_03225 [Candidatus Woesearchaeota archaeon]
MNRWLTYGGIGAAVIGAGIIVGSLVCNKSKEKVETVSTSNYKNPAEFPKRPNPADCRDIISNEDENVDLYRGVNGNDLLFYRDGSLEHIFVDTDKDGKTAERYWLIQKGFIDKASKDRVVTFVHKPGKGIHRAYTIARENAFRGLNESLDEVVDELK